MGRPVTVHAPFWDESFLRRWRKNGQELGAFNHIDCSALTHFKRQDCYPGCARPRGIRPSSRLEDNDVGKLFLQIHGKLATNSRPTNNQVTEVASTPWIQPCVKFTR